MQSKVEKIILDKYGSYLGMEKGCFIVRDKHGNTERYPQFENQIGEVILKSGNTVSVGALCIQGRVVLGFLLLMVPSTRRFP